MKLVCYADDSGTHDPTGAMKGAKQGLVGGIIAPASEWPQFCRDWRSVLTKYNAPYFHFCEWRAASAVARGKRRPTNDYAKNPFKDWSEAALNALLLDLAVIAGAKLTVGGFVLTRKLHLAKTSGDIPESADPYEHGLEQFFAEVLSGIHQLRAPWKRAQVSFVFDQSDKPEWRRAMKDCFARYKAKHPTFATVSSEDKKLALPLQAADMVAFRSRRITSQWADGVKEGEGFEDSHELTEALFKSTFDVFRRNKDEMLRAYISGTFGYDYFKRHG
jgi:hypothetical protein